MASVLQAGTGNSRPHATGSACARPAPAITLRPLHPQDDLLRKWQLEPELPRPSGTVGLQVKEASAAVDGNGCLRLCTLHDDEEKWEYRIPFTALAREGGLILGRGPHGADISLPHETVSRRHARLEIEENGLVITDLSSTNGTCVNEQALSPFDRRVPLAHGSSLQLGTAKLRLEYLL